MICKVCGYEDNENFSVCPYCGERVSSQTQSQFVNQNNQGNFQNPSQYQTPFTSPNPQNNQYNQANQYNSQYQTPFTSPNPQNNQYNQGNQYQNNQYNQGNQYNNNSAPSNNYQGLPRKRVPRRYPNYGRNMPDYFRDFGCSFDITEDEIIMTRNLNGGDFSGWEKFIGILLICFVVFFGPAIFGMILNFFPFPFYIGSDFGSFLFIASFVFAVIFPFFMTRARVTVNSRGITIKTFFRKCFIPAEKIDYITSELVIRGESRSRYGRTTVYKYHDVFIIMKDSSVCNKMDLDTGLCYKNKVHVDYLVDEFNGRLGLLL